jgi:hypothetical protein
MNGAKSRASVVSASYMVWYAASESRRDSAFQKRRRLRRTYHVERSSQNASIRSAAVCESYLSRAARQSRTKRSSDESSQRSINGRSLSGTCASLGSKESRFAYVTKNEYVFQRTRSFRFTSPSTL